MRNIIQAVADGVAKWGPWVLVLLVTACLVALWRRWQNNRSLTAGARISLLLKSSWFSWLVVAGVGLWLLKIQLAPLTSSLTVLQAWKGEPIPGFSFRRVSDDRPH